MRLIAAHEVREVRCRKRPAEMIALILVAADLLEEIELSRRLDALGDDLEA